MTGKLHGWSASLALCMSMAPGPALADVLEAAAGKINGGMDALRLAWHKPWAARWWVSARGELSGWHALSVNHWSHHHNTITALAYSPVFVYHFRDAPIASIRFGVGGAYLSDTQLGGRVLSTRFQFEDQVGIGWQWGGHDLGLIYIHYSNAGIKKPNQGLDMILLAYRFELD